MNIAVQPHRLRETCNVAIIGAGPYGLAAAAHFSAAAIPFRIFGEPMSFWRHNMPHGMLLRSPWVATHIAEPSERFLLDDFYREAGMTIPKLLPVENFVDYGCWFQKRIACDLDTRIVKRIEPHENGFLVALDDDRAVIANRIVMAAGLRHHEVRPAAFDGLPRELVFHSSEHTSSAPYRGKRIAVIGRGQSACEAAAILHEAGAEVDIVCRGSLVWNADPAQRSPLRKAARALLGDKLIPPSQVGPFPYNWVNEAPGIIRHFPEATRDSWNEKNLRATAILWLRPRLAELPVDQGRTILGARRVGDRVDIVLDNATRRFDHVLCATGYRIDVDKMAMLAPSLRARIKRHAGLPVLSGGFESSVPGLHFIGAAAVGSFGPLLRFIAGAGFAARRLTRVAAERAVFDHVDCAPSLAQVAGE